MMYSQQSGQGNLNESKLNRAKAQYECIVETYELFGFL